MSVIQMQSATIHEVEKLFRIMQEHGVRCSMELKVEEDSEPILSIVQAEVSVETFDGNDTILIVDLGNTQFAFNEKESTFHKHFSGSQLDICISSDRFSAWFNSDTLPLRAITEL